MSLSMAPSISTGCKLMCVVARPDHELVTVLCSLTFVALRLWYMRSLQVKLPKSTQIVAPALYECSSCGPIMRLLDSDCLPSFRCRENASAAQAGSTLQMVSNSNRILDCRRLSCHATAKAARDEEGQGSS